LYRLCLLNSGSDLRKPMAGARCSTGALFEQIWPGFGWHDWHISDRLVYRVTATSPGFGLSNVVGVDAKPAWLCRDYRSTATAHQWRHDVLAAAPPTTDIARRFCGDCAQAASSVCRYASGPRSGVDGTIAPSAQRKYQRAVIDAVATNVKLSGAQNLIGRGIIDADIILYDRPHIIADVRSERPGE
jgi:hypothetical protein